MSAPREVQVAVTAQEKTALIDKLPKDATPATNKSIYEGLGWSPEKYYEVRNELADAGTVVRVRGGQGGKTRRAVAEAPAPVVAVPAQQAAAHAAPLTGEAALYPKFESVLKNQWKEDLDLDKLVVRVTARQGKRATGGKWTRPDITAVSYSNFPYVPAKVFEIWTFEVKEFESVDVAAVHEALAHARFATRPFVVSDFPDAPSDEQKERVEVVRSHAARHGIGFVTATDPANYETWNVHVEPLRHAPDPEDMNDFIATQLPDERDAIKAWFGA